MHLVCSYDFTCSINALHTVNKVYYWYIAVCFHRYFQKVHKIGKIIPKKTVSLNEKKLLTISYLDHSLKVDAMWFLNVLFLMDCGL